MGWGDVLDILLFIACHVDRVIISAVYSVPVYAVTVYCTVCLLTIQAGCPLVVVRSPANGDSGWTRGNVVVA